MDEPSPAIQPQPDLQNPTLSSLHLRKLFISIPLAVVIMLLIIFSVGAYYLGRNSNNNINNINVSPTITQPYPSEQQIQYQTTPSPSTQIKKMQSCQSDKNCPIIGYTDRECVNLPSDCNALYAKCINGFCQQKESLGSSCKSDNDCPMFGTGAACPQGNCGTVIYGKCISGFCQQNNNSLSCQSDDTCPRFALPCNINTGEGCGEYKCINLSCVWKQDKNHPIKSPSCKSNSDCNIPCEECKNNKCEKVVGCDQVTDPSQKCKSTPYLSDGSCPAGYYNFGVPMGCVENGCEPDIQ